MQSEELCYEYLHSFDLIKQRSISDSLVEKEILNAKGCISSIQSFFFSSLFVDMSTEIGFNKKKKVLVSVILCCWHNG